ncbi:MAG: hypothetical protein ACC651_07675 [Candidatus Scalindua sp.]
MKRLLKFSTIVFLLLFLIALILLVFIGNSFYFGKGALLTFQNNSGHSISSATISVSGKLCGFKKLENQGEVNCYFENLSDSHYKVEVQLSNGSNYKASLGYVTGGMNFSDVITINEAGEITLASSPST